MEDLVERLTNGNVSAVKVVLTSVAVGLAVYQVAMMAIGYGKVRLPFLKPRAASTAHRSVGDVILPITLLVAWMCYAYFGVEHGIDHATDDETLRVAIHVYAGAALVAVLLLKVVVVRWWTAVNRFLPHLGSSVFCLFVLTWATSAGDYLFGG